MSIYLRLKDDISEEQTERTRRLLRSKEFTIEGSATYPDEGIGFRLNEKIANVYVGLHVPREVAIFMPRDWFWAGPEQISKETAQEVISGLLDIFHPVGWHGCETGERWPTVCNRFEWNKFYDLGELRRVPFPPNRYRMFC